ncbi:hypothetical protein JCM8547_000087 [Rhodosporidiobolus lusitaniae]
MKSLSVLLPLALLASQSVLATPPPDLIESLSSAQGIAPTPAVRLAKRALSSSPSSSSSSASASETKSSTFPSARPHKQSAPVHSGSNGTGFKGPVRLTREEVKYVDDKGRNVTKTVESFVILGEKGEAKRVFDGASGGEGRGKNGTGKGKPSSSPSSLLRQPRPKYGPASLNATSHLLPLDHEPSRLRLRKRGILDTLESVKEEAEAKVGIETKTAELVRESGKVTGDRHHYWYIEPSPEEDAHKAAHAASSASSSAKAAAASERVSRLAAEKPEKEKRAQMAAAGGRQAFEQARQKAREAAQAHHASASAAHAATARYEIVSSSKIEKTTKTSTTTTSKEKETVKAGKNEHSKHNKRGVEDWVDNVGAELAAAGGDATTSAATGGFAVTSTRPASSTAAPSPSSSSSAADPAATSSVEGELLDPSTWGAAISNEATSQYDQLKKKVEGLSVLSKIGLASLILVSVLLLGLLTYCCCKLRIRRRRKRAAERVNASLAAASHGRGGSRGGGRSFDERATAIPMRGFGSASGPAGGDGKDKKGKRRGSWKAFD